MTSGTTGVPKAVEHHHRNVGISARDYYEEVLGCTRKDRSLYRDVALSLRLCDRQQLRERCGTGCGNVLLERWATERTVAETMERFKPTVLLSVPAVYHRLLEAGLPQTPSFRGMRYFVSAGERMPPQIWNALGDSIGPSDP